jgi:hypothetical protein
MTPAEERRIRGAVEREAEVIVKRMQEVMDGLRDLETTYSDRWRDLYAEVGEGIVWTEDDREHLKRLGMPLP